MYVLDHCGWRDNEEEGLAKPGLIEFYEMLMTFSHGHMWLTNTDYDVDTLEIRFKIDQFSFQVLVNSAST